MFSLESILSSLRLPPRLPEDRKPEYEIHRAEWENQLSSRLEQLLAILNPVDLSVSERADILAAVTVFFGPCFQFNTRTFEIASKIVSGIVDESGPSQALMSRLLENDVKPMFRSNPHPSLNLATGRKLARPAGGPMASQDFYEDQAWKINPELLNLVYWCIEHVRSEDYERLWYLIIPPVMTLVDDYEAQFKTIGVQLVQIIAQNAPNGLLKRTGVDGLFHASLKNCLGYLQNPESARLLRATVPATLALIQGTSANSKQSFDLLCALLGDGIIGTVWIYSTDNLGVIHASIEVLPTIIQSLGVGSSRFLKAIIPQLLHPLIPRELQTSLPELQLQSLAALECVMDSCPSRIHLWKGTILAAVSQCWVSVFAETDRNELKTALRSICQKMAHVCPTVAKEEYEQLLAADHNIFSNLVAIA